MCEATVGMAKKPNKRIRKKKSRYRGAEDSMRIQELEEQLQAAQSLAANSQRELEEVASKLEATEGKLISTEVQEHIGDAQAEAELQVALLRHHSGMVEEELRVARLELERTRASLDMYERTEEAERKLSEVLDRAHELSGPELDLSCERLVERSVLAVAADLAVKQATRHQRKVALLAFEPLVSSPDPTLQGLIARRLSTVIRDSDLFARFSSVSYGVLIAEQTAEEDVKPIINAVAERLVGILSETTEFRGEQLCCGAAIGVAVFPWDSESGEQLLTHAEVALSEAADLKIEGVQYFKEGF